MKTWKTPELDIKSIRHTSAPVDTTNMTSGQIAALDLGTCGDGNPYWNGNGLSKEEAIEENPYWGGSWGN